MEKLFRCQDKLLSLILIYTYSAQLKLGKTLATIPVTSRECVRSFSVMHSLKKYGRLRTGLRIV